MALRRLQLLLEAIKMKRNATGNRSLLSRRRVQNISQLGFLRWSFSQENNKENTALFQEMFDHPSYK